MWRGTQILFVVCLNSKIIEILYYVFSLAAIKMKITIAHQEATKNSKTGRDSYLDLELSTFVKIFKFYLVNQSL